MTVHVGERLQASLVLSCPGLDLGGFRRDERGAEPEGLSDELAAVRARVGPETRRQLEQAVRRRRTLRRRLGAEGRWEEETEVRAALREAVPTPDRDDFPSVPPPPIEGPWEALPMYFDQRAAPVALAERGDGWVAVELSAAGGGRSVGVAVPPDRPPELDVSARELLTHYLRYWLERDAFFGALHLEMLDQRPGRMREEAGRALREIGAATVTAAAVRAQLDRGVVGTLGLDDIVRGIRVVDLDWLDRPTWGGRL